MRTLCNGARGCDLLERIDAIALRVESVHQMHLERSIFCRIGPGVMVWDGKRRKERMVVGGWFREKEKVS